MVREGSDVTSSDLTTRLGELLHEQHPVLAGPVVVLRHALDLEPERLVKGDRAGVRGRRDAADAPATVGPDDLEKALVERPSEPGAALLGRDADEVDVGLVGIRLGEEADQEGYEPALVVLGDEARPLEMEEDRKSTRLNSSHLGISYAVFC